VNTAARVAAAKRKYPEDFCPVKGCLWRVYTARGVNPCRNHPAERSETAVSSDNEGTESPRVGFSGEPGPTARSLPDSRSHNADCLCKHCTMLPPF